MKPLSIRASVTAWFVGLTMLLLVAFAATLQGMLGRALRGGIDAKLKARAHALVGVCDWDDEIGAPGFELSEELAAELAAVEPGRGLDVRAWPGLELLHQSGAPIPDPPAAIDVAGPLPLASFSTLDGAPTRRLCALLARCAEVAATRFEPAKPGFDVLVRVTESLAPVEAELARVRWLNLLLVGGSTLVVLAFGFFLSRRVVRPIERLGTAAAAVRAGRREAMPRRGSGDEIDRLAGVLDKSFASLEDALDRQARFTANAAHELRNPIAVIRNAADVALRHERSGDQYREFLADVLVTTDRMAAIVDALLTLARMDAGALQSTFKDVDLAAVARETVAAVAPATSKVRVDDGEAEAFSSDGPEAAAPAPPPVLVRGDARLLRVLAGNLLSNALRFADGQPVDVSVRALPDGGALLVVRDRGPGIPVEARRRVFERFFRLEAGQPDGSGAGLGMSIVAEVARVHSAQCEVEDAAPGARVTVRFPAPGRHAGEGRDEVARAPAAGRADRAALRSSRAHAARPAEGTPRRARSSPAA